MSQAAPVNTHAVVVRTRSAYIVIPSAMITVDAIIIRSSCWYRRNIAAREDLLHGVVTHAQCVNQVSTA